MEELEYKIHVLENRIEQMQIGLECKDRTIWNMQVDITELKADVGNLKTRLDKQCEILTVIAKLFKQQEKVTGDVIDTLRILVR